MKKTNLTEKLALFTLLAALNLLLACCDPPKPSASRGVPDNVQAVLNAKCVSCHNDKRKEAGLNLSTYEAIRAGSTRGAVAIGESADWSWLFTHINGYDSLGVKVDPNFRMPYMAANTQTGFAFDSVNKLSGADVSTIRDWLLARMPDKSGKTMWQDLEGKASGKVFFLCAGSDLVGVQDLATGLISRYFAVGQDPSRLESPHYITLSPDKQFVYVTLIQGGVVEKYRTDNYQLVGRVAVGPSPAHVRLSGDGKRAVITHWTSLPVKLSLIDAENMTILDQITDGGNDQLYVPHGLDIKKDFSACFVSANGGNVIYKIALTSDKFGSITTIPLSPSLPPNTGVYKPYQVLLSPDENTVYVTTNGDSSALFAFDANTTQLKNVLHRIATTDALGLKPRLMTYHNGRIFVASNFDSNFPAQGSLLGSITVVDAASLTVLKKIWNVGQKPHGLAIDEKNNRLIVSLENTDGVGGHHPTNSSFVPGRYNYIDLSTLEVKYSPLASPELASSPSQCVLLP